MKTLRGMTFIDVIVGVGVMLVVFLSIFGAYRIAIDLVLNTKARIGGMSLVAQQLEYVRGLPYEDIGTVGGIPAGNILQLATTSLNNIQYTVRTLATYVDDPADGYGGADTNTITADYKEVKVETLWSVSGRSYSTLGLTRISPHGIESLTSGGTLRVNVFDALAAPVQGASVRVRNASTSPTIDLTISTDVTGSVALPGAPPASNYRINVTKDGYSSAETYDVTQANPNPNPGHVSVANQQTTTASFAIDRTGTLNIYAYSPVESGAFQDDFLSEANLAATTSVDVVAGELLLLEDPDTGFPFSGEARSSDISPTDLASWDLLTWSYTTPPDTTLLVQVVYPNGPLYSPVGDGVIPGNSAGLTSGSVVLSGVPTSTFPILALRAALSTFNASTSPALLEWQLDYSAGPSPLSGVDMTLYGTKTTGTTISGAPIYKVVEDLLTNLSGFAGLSPIEWDSYTLQLTGGQYSVFEECPSPFTVAPSGTTNVNLILLPYENNTLRVRVTGNGTPLSGATVTLTSPGNEVRTTSACGQAFFAPLSADTYTLSVSHPSYQPSTQDIDIAAQTVVSVPLVP